MSAAGGPPKEWAEVVQPHDGDSQNRFCFILRSASQVSRWRARQTEPVRRMVAVKLIKAGMGSKAVLARFEAERQALAMMDHPNIAKILDGGVLQRAGVSTRPPPARGPAKSRPHGRFGGHLVGGRRF
jgi:hypothetical protein